MIRFNEFPLVDIASVELTPAYARLYGHDHEAGARAVVSVIEANMVSDGTPGSLALAAFCNYEPPFTSAAEEDFLRGVRAHQEERERVGEVS